MKTTAIIVAAGRGQRLATPIPKQYLNLTDPYNDKGLVVLARTIRTFAAHSSVDSIQPVIHPDDSKIFHQLIPSFTKVKPPIWGGVTRHESVLEGLKAIQAQNPQEWPDILLIHDAARPLISSGLINRVIEKAALEGAAIPVMPATDTIKFSLEGKNVEKTLKRAHLWQAQTPQAFHFKDYLELAQHPLPREISDDASLFEIFGKPVAMVEGEADAFKITTMADFNRANAQLRARMKPLQPRIGTGFDVHRFGEGHFITICGEKIPHHQGLQGHSDADVGLHAITDALFGAMADGDIGQHFPPDDPKWRDANSAVFLSKACQDLQKLSGKISNIDITLIGEQPKFMPYAEKMRGNVAKICRCQPAQVSIKATTTEKLGFTGRGEGIAAQASILIMLPETNANDG